jgi:hypothetical protein
MKTAAQIIPAPFTSGISFRAYKLMNIMIMNVVQTAVTNNSFLCQAEPPPPLSHHRLNLDRWSHAITNRGSDSD